MIVGTASTSKYRAKNHQAPRAARGDAVFPSTNSGATSVQPKINSASFSQEGM